MVDFFERKQFFPFGFQEKNVLSENKLKIKFGLN